MLSLENKLVRKHLFILSFIITLAMIIIINLIWNLDKFVSTNWIFAYYGLMGLSFFLLSFAFGFIKKESGKHGNIILFCLLNYFLFGISDKVIIYHAYVLNGLPIYEILYASLIIALIPSIVGYLVGAFFQNRRIRNSNNGTSN